GVRPDRRGGRGDGVRRQCRGHRPHLLRPPHPVRGGPRGRPGGRQACHSHLSTCLLEGRAAAARCPGLPVECFHFFILRGEFPCRRKPGRGPSPFRLAIPIFGAEGGPVSQEPMKRCSPLWKERVCRWPPSSAYSAGWAHPCWGRGPPGVVGAVVAGRA